MGFLVTFVSVMLIVIGVLGLLVYPPVGVIAILLSAALFVLYHRHKSRRGKREWRQQMLEK